MKEIILQSVEDVKLFTDLNNISIKTLSHIIYRELPDYHYQKPLLIYTQDDRMLYFCMKEENVEVSPINANYTKIGRRKVFGDHTDKKFIKFKVLSKYKLKRKMQFPEFDKTYYLNKPIHEKLHAELILMTADHLEIYSYVSNDDLIDEGCVAYKLKNKWGFLFYERLENGEYIFRFEPVNNWKDGKRLVQTEEGYKDFTYFIKSQALPKAYKIGRADNPDHRFKTIQAHNARDVVRDLLLADGRLETYYHNKFDHLRISDSREWFEMGDDLLEFITKESKVVNHIYKLFEKSLDKKEIIQNLNN